MTDSVIEFMNPNRDPRRLTEGWNTLRQARRPGLIARLERAFVGWQEARLRTLSPERLWAPAMQDLRSFAEIRRERNAATR
ncbi:hypothetical protein [Bordetella sp. 15P40C-2]|uniref:hypothetical protein n=1 Tax=Bordetella sp. 15P40C-2 TaxID=2572246 RepID=UPI0013287859|nr:hypothetical protein [Bordetella sp. 15P40C-2]MVW70294.1 hypothetical protein [Bordetella sp. 15P40C-2]